MRIVFDTNVLIAAFIARDNDLLVLENFNGIAIIKPADFSEYEAAL